MDEEQISAEEAARVHGVIARHGRMSRTGEFRFRLLKNDGTAYIRTEASASGGWQKSHWHNKVRETYIVQRGWIGYAELVDGLPRYRIYRAGDLFTTAPFIIHNVYMPANAVIHTVKHGDGRDEKRLEDERSEYFTALTEVIDESELRRLSSGQSFTNDGSEFSYSDSYRHFDNLIWQGSVWSSGLFTIALAGMTQVSNTNPLLTALSLNYTQLLALVSAMFAGFILVISHALYRFRWHQFRAKSYSPRHSLRSPQVGLQLMVNLQALVLLAAAFALAGWHRWLLSASALLVVLGIEFYQENRIKQAKQASLKPRETRS